MLKLAKAGKTYTFDSTALSRHLPSDLVIGENEDFSLYILSNKLIIKHINEDIVSIELAKDKSEKIA